MLLRPWRESDAAAVESVRHDDRVSRWSNLAVESADEWMARQRDRTDGVSRAIATGSDEIAIGKVALRLLADEPTTAELSYWLVPTARGHGYAAAACRELSGWAFESGGLRGIRLDVETDNAASERVARALGAVRAEAFDHTEIDRAGVARELRAWVLT